MRLGAHIGASSRRSIVWSCALLMGVYPLATLRAQIVYLNPQGTYAGAGFVHSAVGCPDVDGDGRGDVLVGVPAERVGDPPRERGAAYVFSGRDGSVIHQLVSPRAILLGYFGDAVAASPDLNGDGRAELIVGAHSEHSAYVFSGIDGALLYNLRPSPTAAYFGTAVASIPDLDQDGIADFAVGASGASRVYVYSGATGILLYHVDAPTPGPSPAFGEKLAGVPDLDGDGSGDILVGCPSEIMEDRPGHYVFGRAYVLSGRDGSLIRSIDAPQQPPEHFAHSVAGLPDIDGDGLGDYVIGDPYRCLPCGLPIPGGGGVQNGAAHVYSGATGKLLATLTSPLGPQYWYAVSVAGAPDVDGDGFGEIIVGARRDTWPDMPMDAGAAYIYSGATRDLLQVFLSPTPRPPGSGYGGQLGSVVATVPDMSGDGRIDIVAGAPGDCSRTTGPCPPAQNGRFYIYPSCAADFNYNGRVDSQDFFDLLHAFFEDRPSADINRSGDIDSADFFAFLEAFLAGCDT